MTQPIASAQALAYGPVDAVDARSDDLLRRRLLRLRRLGKPAIARHKRYLAELDPRLAQARAAALAANRGVLRRRQPAGDRALRRARRGAVGPIAMTAVAIATLPAGVMQITMQDREHKNTFSPALIAGRWRRSTPSAAIRRAARSCSPATTRIFAREAPRTR